MVRHDLVSQGVNPKLSCFISDLIEERVQASPGNRWKTAFPDGDRLARSRAGVGIGARHRFD
jgi:hypothetical protein